MSIYTLNGFDDIKLNINSLLSTRIYCDDETSPEIDFDDSCVISPIFPHRSCINDTTTCNGHYIETTLNPTIEPTANPITTPVPTVNPSITNTNLISLTPTNNPIITIQPTTGSTTNDPSVIPTANPTNELTISPTLSLSSRPTVRPKFESLMTSTEYKTFTNVASTTTIKQNGKYSNDTISNDNVNSKAIVINLTNLMYIIVGTVFVCCMVCGLCLLFNLLSTRIEIKNIEVIDKYDFNDKYNVNDTNCSTFQLRRNSNSSSQIHSESDRNNEIIIHYEPRIINTNNKNNTNDKKEKEMIKTDSGFTMNGMTEGTSIINEQQKKYWIDNRCPRGKEESVPVFTDFGSGTVGTMGIFNQAIQ